VVKNGFVRGKQRFRCKNHSIVNALKFATVISVGVFMPPVYRLFFDASALNANQLVMDSF
jgi:hypothetical protein